MTMYTAEHTAYPVRVTIVSNADKLNGVQSVIPKARITYRDGTVSVYDTNAPTGFVFSLVLSEPDDGNGMQRFGNEVEVTLYDGRIVRASAPQGCGCGDPGKRYLWPNDTAGVVFYG
jgi:hypothetical protein